jgi:hypothetical protein
MSAIIRRIPPPAAKIHQLSEVLYAKFSSHFWPPHHEMGTAMWIAMPISLRKSYPPAMIRPIRLKSMIPQFFHH